MPFWKQGATPGMWAVMWREVKYSEPRSPGLLSGRHWWKSFLRPALFLWARKQDVYRHPGERGLFDECGRLVRCQSLENEARTWGINIVNDLLTGKQIPFSPSGLNRHQVHDDKRADFKQRAVWWGAEPVSVLAITWSEKTLSGQETGPGLCAVTENRDADRDTGAILCQGYSNTVCGSNESWHHSLSLGVFSARSCRTFLPRHHYKTRCCKFRAALFCQSTRGQGA